MSRHFSCHQLRNNTELSLREYRVFGLLYRGWKRNHLSFDIHDSCLFYLNDSLTIFFRYVQNIFRPLVYSIPEVIVFRFLWGFVQKRNDISKNVRFRSLRCGRKATLDCLKWSVFKHSCRPHIKGRSLFQKQHTIT